MLSHIQIRNFAIIDRVDLELAPGLTVLSGETGAGKSILVDALGLVLGDRADATALRHGADRGEITASFRPAPESRALAWLAEQALDSDCECVVRRVLNRSGRSQSFINGRAVPLSSLRQLGDFLADIHGQHEHQSLVRADVQREILDFLGGHQKLVAETARAFAAWQALAQTLSRLRGEAGDRATRLELLGHHVRELEALNMERGEPARLEAEHRRLAQSERLLQSARAALSALGGDDDTGGAQSVLAAAARELDGLRGIDPTLNEPAELVESAEIQVNEAIETLRRYVDDLDMDPGRLGWLDERLATIQQLARKHKVEADALPQLGANMSAELAALEGADARIDEITGQLRQQEQAYLAVAARLTRARRKAADRMNKAVTKTIEALGMPGGRFEARATEIDGENGTAHGRDRIEFCVSANAGQPPAPLARVASGGELSRISLAIQVLAADAAPTGCLVFDEVDAGVGGGVAEIVGRRLRELGNHRQVLCVTHLPQVASQAHHHVRVSKLTDGRTTRTSVTVLGADEAVEEVARMLGGVEITGKTRAHAREMIQKAREA